MKKLIGALAICSLLNVSTYAVEDISKRVIEIEVSVKSSNVQADQKYVDLALKIKNSIKSKRLNKKVFNNLYQEAGSSNIKAPRSPVINNLNEETIFYLRMDAAFESVQRIFEPLSSKGSGYVEYWKRSSEIYEFVADGAVNILFDYAYDAEEYNKFLAHAITILEDDLRNINVSFNGDDTYYMNKTVDIVELLKKVSANIQQIRDSLPLD